MAGAALRVDLDATAAIARIGRLALGLRDPRPMLAEIGARLEATTRERFESEREPGGAPWLPSQRAQREGGQTLTDSGRLRASITHVVRGSGAGAEVLVGTNVVYAAIHQFGGTVKRAARTQTLAFNAAGRFLSRRNARRRRAGSIRVAFARIGEGETEIPARPFLGLSDGDSAAILRIARKHLDEAIR